jgi:hypothetical protein
MTSMFPICIGESDDNSAREDEIDQEDMDEAVNVDNWKCPKCGNLLKLISGKFMMGDVAAVIDGLLVCEIGKRLCWETILHVRVIAKRDPVRYKRIKEIFCKSLAEI